MIEYLKGYVLNIAAVSIFVVLLEIIVPSGKTRKIVSMISGLILIIAILNPLFSLIKSNTSVSELQIPGSNFLNKKEIEDSSKILEQKRMKQIVEEYRKNIINELAGTAESVAGVKQAEADVILNEDYSSPGFGDIKRIYLEVSLKGKENSDVKVVPEVKKIEINSKVNEKQQKKGADIKNDTGMNKKIEALITTKIKELFGIEKENIVITIM